MTTSVRVSTFLSPAGSSECGGCQWLLRACYGHRMEGKYVESLMLKIEGKRLIRRRRGRGTKNMEMFPTLIEL